MKDILNRFKKLKNVWLYSDSQPTEILLAVVNIFSTPIASYIELGPVLLVQIFMVLTGIYQLWCVSNGDLKCRLRASLFTFGMYFATLLMYIGMIGIPTPTHMGWFVLFIASLSSLLRIKSEEIITK